MVLAGVQEYCEGERFSAKCERDEAIIIQSAFYGRMRLGRCVRMNMGYIGCEAPVLDVADQKCSGRHQCEIKVNDCKRHFHVIVMVARKEGLHEGDSKVHYRCVTSNCSVDMLHMPAQKELKAVFCQNLVM